jgi:hypothetical protein
MWSQIGGSDRSREDSAGIGETCHLPSSAAGAGFATTVPYRKNRNPAQRAERLIRELGDGAYERARRGEREATDPQTAAYWHRVAFVIANRTGGKGG